jgi:excisionase family DNA binding protein
MKAPARESEGKEPVTSLADLVQTRRAVITVEELAQVLEISRGKAFESVRNGDISALRLGARWLVPVPRLRALLGVDAETAE